jgi:hypothetical protein
MFSGEAVWDGRWFRLSPTIEAPPTHQLQASIAQYTVAILAAEDVEIARVAI